MNFIHDSGIFVWRGPATSSLVKNGERFVVRTIESILSQTFQDFELISLLAFDSGFGRLHPMSCSSAWLQSFADRRQWIQEAIGAGPM